MTEENFGALYREHHAALLRTARRRLSASADAEDATAEVFRLAWAHHRAGNEVTSPWLYAALRNVVGHEYRRAARRAALHAGVVPLSRVESDEPDVVTTASVQSALAVLAPLDRFVVTMTYWDGLSAPELAVLLGCSAVAVRLRLTKARRRLESMLAH